MEARRGEMESLIRGTWLGAREFDKRWAALRSALQAVPGVTSGDSFGPAQPSLAGRSPASSNFSYLMNSRLAHCCRR